MITEKKHNFNIRKNKILKLPKGHKVGLNNHGHFKDKMSGIFHQFITGG